jgi:hypothetical protein
MSVAIKKVTLWRAEVDNKPGTLRGVLAPLAAVGADLQVVTGGRCPGDKRKAVIEIGPLTGKKTAAAASKAGLTASSIPSLVVQGVNHPGIGHAIAEAIAEARINVTFLSAQVIDSQFSAVIGFANETAAGEAAVLIKKAAKEIDRRFASAASEGANGKAPPLRERAPILCRKKCDILLNAFCTDSGGSH